MIYRFGHLTLAPGAPVAAPAALHPGLLAYTLKLHPLGVDVVLLAPGKNIFDAAPIQLRLLYAS